MEEDSGGRQIFGTKLLTGNLNLNQTQLTKDKDLQNKLPRDLEDEDGWVDAKSKPWMTRRLVPA